MHFFLSFSHKIFSFPLGNQVPHICILSIFFILFIYLFIYFYLFLNRELCLLSVTYLCHFFSSSYKISPFHSVHKSHIFVFSIIFFFVFFSSIVNDLCFPTLIYAFFFSLSLPVITFSLFH